MPSNLISAIFLGSVLAFLGCNESNSNERILDADKVYGIIPLAVTEGAMMSCTRCSCFLSDLDSAHQKRPEFFSKIAFFTDTNCNKLRFKTQHVSQKTFDSLSLDLYNVVLFKRVKDKVVCRIIDQEEHNKLMSILQEYFD